MLWTNLCLRQLLTFYDVHLQRWTIFFVKILNSRFLKDLTRSFRIIVLAVPEGEREEVAKVPKVVFVLQSEKDFPGYRFFKSN